MDAVIEDIKERILSGTITVPGDKSITHRGIILGSIARGTTMIKNFLDSSDCKNTMMCMQSLGVKIKKIEGSPLEIQGKGLKGLRTPENTLQTGNSGTTIRLLAGLLCGQNFNSILDGDKSIRKRPMKRVIEPLSLMGGRIKGLLGNEFAPLNIAGSRLQGISYTLPIASAQVKSAILLASLYAEGKTTVHEPEVTRDHTERMLSLMKANIQTSPEQETVMIPGEFLEGTFIDIPGDISSAAYFLALVCARKGSEIYIENVGINPTRTGFIDVLKEMGADINLLNRQDISNEPRADIRINGVPLKGVCIDRNTIPSIIDELPLLAVIATQAQGKTIVRDAQELRVKETDRIKAIVKGLSLMGANILEKDDGFEVTGPTDLKGNIVNSDYDHRIAMSLAIAASYARGRTVIKQRECINISYPDFLKTYFDLIK